MKKYKPIDWSKCPESRTPIGNPNNCVVADILPDGKTEILFAKLKRKLDWRGLAWRTADGC